MAKIGEQFYKDGDKLIHVKQQDYNSALNQADDMRQNGNAHFGESVCVGVVDRAMINEWLKEAGVKWTDPAMHDVIKRKMLHPDFDKFRVWKGNYQCGLAPLSYTLCIFQALLPHLGRLTLQSRKQRQRTLQSA